MIFSLLNQINYRYCYSIVVTGDIEEVKGKIKISLNFELPEEAKIRGRSLMLFQIIALGFMIFRITDQNKQIDWFYIVLPVIGIFFLQILANYAIKSASNVFLIKFNEVMN
jgi:hypothetical protein